jgi:lipopolysaccharide/colanic/teichoic acid biosynthesis glycosyltransferase
MNVSSPFWLAILGRFMAFFLLVAIFPTLLLVGLFIGITAGHPVLVADSMTTSQGTVVQVQHFRTTGSGTRLFKHLGRMFRQYGLDRVPILWGVVRGDVSLMEFVRLLNRL